MEGKGERIEGKERERNEARRRRGHSLEGIREAGGVWKHSASYTNVIL